MEKMEHLDPQIDTCSTDKRKRKKKGFCVYVS